MEEKKTSYNTSEFIENAIEWINNEDSVYVTFSQQKYRNKILKLAKEYPEEVHIISDNGGKCIYAKIPLKWVKINHPRRTREWTEEDKRQLSERMRRGKS